MQKNTPAQLILLLLLLLTASCSNTRHLPKGERLYTSSTVHILDNEANRQEKKLLHTDLNGLVRPKPNTKVLGIRLKLRLYTMAGNTHKTKGLRTWLRNKVGEPPVLASTVHLNTNKELMLNYLMNRGYFYAKVTPSLKEDKGNKAHALFEVTTGKQYLIGKSYFTKDSSAISVNIDSCFDKTLLTPNAPYNLNVIKAERARIDRWLKEKGFYYFTPDYIIIWADTSIGDYKVNMYVKLKHREIPAEAYQPFTINNIFVYANYQLGGNDQDTSEANAVTLNDYTVIDNKKSFRPAVFSQAMVFEKGDLYSQEDHNASLNRLVNMGTFKFVKNRFQRTGDSLLDVYYYLTPFSRKSIRFEVGALTQNDNRAGTTASVSWKNRNAFKGAEQLLFKINGGFEAQYSGGGQRPNIYNFGAETNLSVPRFAIPFVQIQSIDKYLPHTLFKLKYQFESASKLLTINSYNAAYGYEWKQGYHITHQLYPVSFTFVRTDTLGSADSLSKQYGNLVFNGIIAGTTYEFTYTSQGLHGGRDRLYFDGLLDVAGNALGISEKADYRKSERLLFGSHYAQYVKIQPDFRLYHNFSPAASLASRLLLGLGVPYGNSDHLPNVKQFWAGGNSDLRGFPSRLVGPGIFDEYSKTQTRKYIETLGDIKLEGNIEWRQKLYKFVGTAIFVDAGNIWLYRDNPDFPGGSFSSSFIKELCVDAGVGLRFDFSILILRFDLGIPMRKAWYPENERWVFNKIDFHNKQWRQENMVFNIGIGYPF